MENEYSSNIDNTLGVVYLNELYSLELLFSNVEI